MSNFITQLIFNIKKRGFLALTFNICYRIIRKIIPIEYLLFYEIDLHKLGIKQHPQIELNFRKADLKEIDELDHLEYELAEFNRDDECYIGFTNKIIAYIWISYKSIRDDKIFNFNLKSKQAYIYKAFTHPAYRGCNIYPALLNWICVELRKNKIEKCYIVTTAENLSSIRGISKVGFKKIGYAIFLKIRKYEKLFLPKRLQALAAP